MDYYKKKIDMNDINYTLELDFFESIHGCNKKIKIKYYKICDICNGIGMINSTICPDCKMKILNQEINKKNNENDKDTKQKIKKELETNEDLKQEFNISIDQELNKNSNNIIQDLNFDKNIFSEQNSEKNILQFDNFNLNDLQNNNDDSLGIDLLKQDIETINNKINENMDNKIINQELNQISNQNNKICKRCHNTGYIFLSNCPICKNGLKQTEKEIELTIQPRCDESTRYIIKNFNKGINGGKNGNLIINFKIINDTKFKIINNDDIQFKLDINMKDAILGKVIAIPTIYKKYYKLSIPKFTQQGTKIIIKQLGLLKNVKIKDNNTINNYGNMIVKINVIIPVNLNEKQLKLIKQL